MANLRFKMVGSKELLELLEKRDSENTKRVMKRSLTMFDSFCAKENVPIENLSIEELNETLKLFSCGTIKDKRTFFKETNPVSRNTLKRWNKLT